MQPKNNKNKKVKTQNKMPKSNKFKVQNDNIVNKLNTLQKQLKELDKTMKIYKNPGNFLASQDINKITASYRLRKEWYLKQLLDPRKAVEEGKVVGLPMELPLPTTLLAYHQQNTLQAYDGKLAFYWMPAFFNTYPNMEQLVDGVWVMHQQLPKPTHSFYSNLYNVPLETDNLQAFPSKTTTIDFQKYRLVAASIHLRYTSTVLNQSGIAYASMNYTEDIPNITYSTTFAGETYSEFVPEELDPIGPPGIDVHETIMKFIDKDNILNSNFSMTNPVQVGTDTRSAIYLPSDPISKSFKKPGTVGSSDIRTKVKGEQESFGELTCGTGSPNLGAQPIYSFRVEGLQGNDTAKFAIDTYYIWEVIPPASEAALFKSAKASAIPLTDSELSPYITSVMQSPIKPGKWDWLKSTASTLAKQYGPKILKKGAEVLGSLLI